MCQGRNGHITTGLSCSIRVSYSLPDPPLGSLHIDTTTTQSPTVILGAAFLCLLECDATISDIVALWAVFRVAGIHCVTQRISAQAHWHVDNLGFALKIAKAGSGSIIRRVSYSLT